MKLIKTLTATSLLALSTLASAQVVWLPTSDSDLQAQALEQSARNLPASLHQEQAPVSMAWSPTQALQGRPFSSTLTAEELTGPHARSQGYWMDVTGAQLAAGVALPISAPGAVIRISALESGSQTLLDQQSLQLAMNGRALTADFGPQTMATGSQMRSQGMRVPTDSLAFRLGRDSSAGSLTVNHAGLPPDRALVIHVHEPNSEWVAELSLPRANVLSGETLDFDLRIGNSRQTLQTRSVQAVLVSPDASQSWAMAPSRQGQLTLTAAPLAARSQPGAGLYEAHVYAEAQINGITVRRDLTLALNIAPAIARFNGQVNLSRSAGVSLDLGIDAVAAGRYQVNAELMGTNKSGQLQTIAVVQSAAVLGARGGNIRLDIDQELLNASGLGAPFEVHNLMLLDQGRMYLLEQRERALRIAR